MSANCVLDIVPFVCINSLDSLNNPMRLILLLSPFDCQKTEAQTDENAMCLRAPRKGVDWNTTEIQSEIRLWHPQSNHILPDNW